VRSGAVCAVIFDLDDTLFPQRAWLAGAFDAVADEACRLGADRARLRRGLDEALEGGSDRGHTIDRGLEIAGETGIDTNVLLKAFRSFVPGRIEPFPGVREAVERLAARVPLALVTDGYVAGQQGKLDATGLAPMFSVVVYSDQGGRGRRKPNPAGMLQALGALGVPAEHVVVVGDRPEKDVAAAHAAAMRAIRVRTGEYASRPDLPGTFASVDSVAAAAELVDPLLEVVRP
jgi:HAD superfamily hydrolase (TIGR01509 family)